MDKRLNEKKAPALARGNGSAHIGNTYDYLPEELKRIFAEAGEPAYRGLQVFEALHKQAVSSWQEATSISKSLRDSLTEEYPLDSFKLKSSLKGADGTIKLIFETKTKDLVEGVIIPAKYGPALCMSTQIGCPVGCSFCKTGQMGFSGNLSAGEIVLQFILAERYLKKPIESVILMGMGEPMLNFENVTKALEILTHTNGRQLSSRRITVSTVGFPREIRNLATRKHRYNIALSLQFTSDETRKKYIPVARKQPLQAIFDALEDYYSITSADVTLEYVLFEGINCSNHDARALSYLARWGFSRKINDPDYLVDFFSSGKHMQQLFTRESFKINLIPYNPIDTDYDDIGGRASSVFKSPSDDRILDFLNIIKRCGARVTLRKPRGRDIGAACGMLGRIDSNRK